MTGRSIWRAGITTRVAVRFEGAGVGDAAGVLEGFAVGTTAVWVLVAEGTAEGVNWVVAVADGTALADVDGLAEGTELEEDVEGLAVADDVLVAVGDAEDPGPNGDPFV
jgi:hypothetical protein